MTNDLEVCLFILFINIAVYISLHLIFTLNFKLFPFIINSNELVYYHLALRNKRINA